ncbi:MAG: MFS transporter [Castellaniella sp.]
MAESDFHWREIIVPAYGPSILFGLGKGAVLPIIALTAIDLNASHAVSGFIVALVGLGSLINNMPAAHITARLGERLALVGASVFSMLGLLLCILARGPTLLGVGVFMLGMSTSVFYLARQTYLIDVVPVRLRARAFSMLGGTERIGLFAGPFGAAAIMHFMGLDGAYWLAIVALAAAGMLSFAIPDSRVAAPQRTTADGRPAPRTGGTDMISLARRHRHVLLTLGMGVMLIGALRASRQVAVPLWAEYIGLSPAATAVVFGLISGIDMLVFYPAGKIMDEHGRLWVALPCTLLLGLSFVSIPMTASLLPFVLISAVMGFGNGIGSGIVMTLGADASPAEGRTQFLGLWRLISDIGTSSGPVLLAGITAAASLAAGIGIIGLSGFVAAAIFWRHLPHGKPAPGKPAPDKAAPAGPVSNRSAPRDGPDSEDQQP